VQSKASGGKNMINDEFFEITRKGRIIGVSKSIPGSVHDFALLK
jgi:hypothetical protein